MLCLSHHTVMYKPALDENLSPCLADTIYKTSYEFIQGLDDKQLKKFIIYYRDKIKLIETIAPTEAKAFQLFEILNDRGRSLEPMDLIKNGFLRTLTMEGKPEVKIDEFNSDWRETMDNLQPKKIKSYHQLFFFGSFCCPQKV